MTFTSLLTTALAISLCRCRPISSHRLGFGVALALVVVLGLPARVANMRVRSSKPSRQAEIIALLLSEFEAGSSDWIWETGPDGRLSYVSERMAQIAPIAPAKGWSVPLSMQAAGRPRRAGTWRQVTEHMARHETLHEVLPSPAKRLHVVAAHRAAPVRRRRQLSRLSRRRQGCDRAPPNEINVLGPRKPPSRRARPNRNFSL